MGVSSCARQLIKLARSSHLLSRPRVALECDIRAKSGRGEAVEPFEITDEMAVIAHTDVVVRPSPKSASCSASSLAFSIRSSFRYRAGV